MDRRSLVARARKGHHASMDREGLADFLRRRRETLQPDDVGMTVGPRRRAAGLRREEVASLSGMSTDYYARLEQRRGPRPSEQMLGAIARGLRLSIDERDHLFRLAGHTPPVRNRRSDHVSPSLMRVLDRLEDTPALILSDLGETLVQNRLAVALLGDHAGHTGLARSGFYRWFTDPAERLLYPESAREHQSRLQAAGLRAALGLRGDDPRAAELVDDLLRRSPEFARLWDRQEVGRRFDERKTLVHPELGPIEVDCQVLVTEDQGQILLVLTASPGTESHGKLQLLATVGTERFGVAAEERG
jgi:transcriptional regulator with XRE-family HTH domain